MLRFCILTVLLGGWLFLSAQDEKSDCELTLEKVQELYRSGLLNQMPTAELEGCIKNFPKEQKIEAYRLLINRHLFRDEMAPARELMGRLLELEPEIQASITDPKEFSYLLDEFDVNPKHYWEIRLGGLRTHRETLRRHSLDRVAGVNNRQISSRTGFTAHLGFQKPLTRWLQLGVGLNYALRTYTYDQVLITDASAEDLNFSNLFFRENQHHIELPLTLRVAPTNKLRIMINKAEGQYLAPYFYGGVAGHHVLRAGMRDLQRTLDKVTQGQEGVADPGDSTGVQITATRYSLFGEAPLRNRWNVSLQVGGGLMYKLGHNYLVLDLRADLLLLNQARPDNRYANRQLVYSFGYLDDDFLLYSMPALTVGWRRIIYDPKRR